MGVDPYDLSVVFREIAQSLKEINSKLNRKAKQFGISLDNMVEEEEAPPVETSPTFKLAKRYGDEVGKFLLELQPWVERYRRDVILMTIVGVLAHSRFYVAAKIGRAIDSRWEEEKCPDLPDDSKTSAFFAYLAISRNCRALKTFIYYYGQYKRARGAYRLLGASEQTAKFLRQEFFPCEYLDTLFAIPE